MKKGIKITSLWIVAGILILIGITGMFLPIIPGILLILLGIYLLSKVSVSVKTRTDRVRARFPRFHHHLSAFEEKMERLFKRHTG